MPIFISHDYSVFNNEAKMWRQGAIVDSMLNKNTLGVKNVRGQSEATMVI